MAGFSIGEAYGAGFGLIARRPLSVIVWGLVVSFLRMAPVVLMIWLAGPGIMEAWGSFAANMAAGGDPQDASDKLRTAMSSLDAYSALQWLFGFVAIGLIHAAIFRAMIRPEDGGLFGLKLGMDEVWQALIYFVASILICIFAVLVVLATAAVGGIVYLLGEAVGSPLGGWIKALGLTAVGVSCIVAIIWIALRFSLAGPATFASRSFQFFESWSLTKGQSWSLLGLALLLGLTMFAVELVLGGIFVAAFISLGALDSLSPEAFEAFFSQPFETWIAQLAPWLVAGGLIGAVLSGAFYAFLLAPFASVYRQLTGAPAA
jgi:hypothetical protein